MIRIVATRPFALALLLALVCGCAALPPNQGEDLEPGRLGDQWTVKLDPALGTPATMTNRSTDEGPATRAAISDSAAEAAVRGVIRDYALWFRLRPGVDDFRLARSYPRGWIQYVKLVQTYRSIPVCGGGYEARVFSSGRVASLEGRFHPNLQIDIRPSIGAEQAEQRARVTVQTATDDPVGLPRFQYEYENGFSDPRALVLVPRAGAFALAWGVVVHSSPTQAWRIYVDATSGEPIGYEFVGYRQQGR